MNQALKDHCFTILNEYNKGRSLPYHGNHHAMNVMEMLEMLLPADIDIPPWLIIAAVFHDMNHFGGNQPDSVNITSAVMWICDNVSLIHPEAKDDLEKIVSTIRDTEFPHKQAVFTKFSLYLRDADILSVAINPIEVCWGFYNEQRDCGAIPSTMSFAESLDKSIQFYNSYKFQTKEGADFWGMNGEKITKILSNHRDHLLAQENFEESNIIDKEIARFEKLIHKANEKIQIWQSLLIELKAKKIFNSNKELRFARPDLDLKEAKDIVNTIKD